MIITVAEIVQALRLQKKTCVVTFTLAGDDRLFKVYVRDGEACAISLGPLRDADCLAALNGLRLKQYTFIPESGERMPAGRLTQELSARLNECDTTVCGGADNVFGSTVRIEPTDPRILSSMEEAVIGIAGPVAGHLLEESFRTIGYQRGAGLSPGALCRLTLLLAEELPADDRSAFLSRFRTASA